MVKPTQCSQDGNLGNICSRARRSAHCAALAVLLITAASVCRSAPAGPKDPAELQELQILKQIDHVCSPLLSREQKPQADSLEELCFLIMVGMGRSQGLKVRGESKRFLFHYTKPQGHASSDLTLVPQFHVRRLKRFTGDQEDLQGPGGIQSRGYFLYRPRNGRSSVAVA